MPRLTEQRKELLRRKFARGWSINLLAKTYHHDWRSVADVVGHRSKWVKRGGRGRPLLADEVNAIKKASRKLDLHALMERFRRGGSTIKAILAGKYDDAPPMPRKKLDRLSRANAALKEANGKQDERLRVTYTDGGGQEHKDFNNNESGALGFIAELHRGGIKPQLWREVGYEVATTIKIKER